jgi:hypothetical protein
MAEQTYLAVSRRQSLKLEAFRGIAPISQCVNRDMYLIYGTYTTLPVACAARRYEDK